jgi:hypothetical protein
MILTTEQLNILNHIVVDGQAWSDNAKTTEAQMLQKVAKYKSSYDDAVANGNYKTRKQRDEAEELAKAITPMETWKRAMAKSDRLGMPRGIEDLITDNPTLNVNASLQAKYDAKVARRAEKP